MKISLQLDSFCRACAGGICAILVMGVATVHAGTPVRVVVNGEVESNLISESPLGDVDAGDSVVLSFLLDSDDFLDSAIFPTRGYVIDQDSYSLTMGATTIGLQNPYPAGETPYFVLRDNDPAVDGFLTANSPDVGFPTGNELDQTGRFDQFKMVYATTYPGDTLDSLDIVDAAGFYDFTGLSVFSMRISDGFVESAMGMIFSDMTITVIPEPATFALCAPLAGLLFILRRRFFA